MARKITVFDTTLRDGEQTPGVNLNLREKLIIARELETLGVDIIEAGFPAASPGDFESVRAVARQACCGVAALCRCVEADIRTAWDALREAKRPRLHVFLATSPIHMEFKLKLSSVEVLARAVEGVRLAKSLCDDVEFSCEDASRSDPAFLYQVLEAVIDAGATTVNIPDTVGYALPDEFAALIAGIRANVPNIGRAVVSVHCHNDLGLATANTLAAVGAGAGQIETTLAGIGERAGNCAMEETIMAMATRQAQMDVTHGIDTTKIYPAARRVSKLTAVPLGVCKAIVGQNAFAHESGIHQHGMLANPMTYEIMTPQSVGKIGSDMVLGKHSGRHAFRDRLEQLGLGLEGAELDTAFARFKELADGQKQITDADLEALATQHMAAEEALYTLESFQIQSGNRVQAVASVCLTRDEEPLCEAATGDGPVDAAYNAIARMVGDGFFLLSYDIRAVTRGKDALGEVTVRVEHEGREYTGRGLAGDILEASVRAYLSAINRACLAGRDGFAKQRVLKKTS